LIAPPVGIRGNVQPKRIGRLLRTVFLADYFINPAFRPELLRVLHRGEATNALKR
jgi:TnpA family transposase